MCMWGVPWLSQPLLSTHPFSFQATSPNIVPCILQREPVQTNFAGGVGDAKWLEPWRWNQIVLGQNWVTALVNRRHGILPRYPLQRASARYCNSKCDTRSPHTSAPRRDTWTLSRPCRSPTWPLGKYTSAHWTLPVGSMEPLGGSPARSTGY